MCVPCAAVVFSVVDILQLTYCHTIVNMIGWCGVLWTLTMSVGLIFITNELFLFSVCTGEIGLCLVICIYDLMRFIMNRVESSSTMR